MRTLIFTFLLIALNLSSCTIATIQDVKFTPQYQGVDPKTKLLVDEFLWIASQKKIKFIHNVTVGFKHIKTDNIIGLCTYGYGWREIDLDIDFWNKSRSNDQLAVLFHELTHCYCARGHDWGKGVTYKPTDKARTEEALDWIQNGGERPGRYEDGCPTSLMFPIVVENECVNAHYDDYVSEMFNRCKPY